MEKARVKCLELINLLKKNKTNNIRLIYKNEYTKNIYKFDRHMYLTILENKLGKKTGVYKQINK